MNIPNDDIASDDSLAGQMSTVLKNFKMEFEDMLPAKVISYDDETNRAVIQPLVMMGTTDGQKISRGKVPNIPVFRFGAGGFFIRVPVKVGDFGWLKANDRDISLIFQRGGLEDWPNTERLHSFSDAMFFPDVIKDWVIDGKNIDALVIQSIDGSVCIALHSDKITLDAPTFEITAETTCRGNFTVIGNSSTNGNVTTNGNFSLNGTLSAVGGAFTHNGKNVGATHTHSNVQRGNDTSGGPT